MALQGDLQIQHHPLLHFLRARLIAVGDSEGHNDHHRLQAGPEVGGGEIKTSSSYTSLRYRLRQGLK